MAIPETMGVGTTSAYSAAQSSVTSANNGVSSANTALQNAEQRLSTARENLELARTQATSTQEQITAAEQAVTEAESARDELRTQLETANEQVDTLTTEAETAAEAVTTAQDELETANENLETLNTERTDIEGQLRSAEQAKTEADQQLTEATTRVEEATTARQQAQEALTTAQGNTEQARTALETATQREQDALQAYEQAQQATEEARTAVDTARERVETATSRVEELTTQRDDISAQLTDARSAKTAADEALTAANERVTTAQADVDAKQTAYTQAQDLTRQRRTELTDAQTAETQARDAYTQAQDTTRQRETALTNAENALTQATQNVQAKEGAVESARSRVEGAQSRVNRAQSELAAAEAALRRNPDDPAAKARVARARAALSSARSELSSAQAALRAAEEALRQAREAERRAREAAEAARRALEEARAAEERARVAMEAAIQAREQAEQALQAAEEAEQAALEALEAAREELEAAQTAQQEAQQAAEEAAERVTELEEQLAQVEEQLATAQEELEAAQAELEAAEEALAAAEEAEETARAEAEAATEARETAEEELEAAEEAEEAAQEELEAAETELEEAEAAKEEAQTAVDEAEAEVTELEETLADIEQQITEAEQARDDAQAALEEAEATKEEKETALEEARTRAEDLQDQLDAAEQAVTEANTAKTEAVEAHEAKQTAVENAEEAVSEAEAAVDTAREAVTAANQRLEEAQNDAREAEEAERESRTAAERERVQGENIDAELAAMTEEERQALLREQDALLEQEDGVREPTAPGENATDSQWMRYTQQRQQYDSRIHDIRQTYFDEQGHEIWIDANGTAYRASLDSSGNIELEREEEAPATPQTPPAAVRRTATIRTDQSRTSNTEIRPETPQGQPEQVIIETVHNDSEGNETGSARRIEQEQTAPDGTVETASVEEDYDANRDLATVTVETATDSPAGADTQTSDVTNYRPDGTRIDQVQTSNTTQPNGDTQEQTVESTFRDDDTLQHVLNSTTTNTGDVETQRVVETDYEFDGINPLHQVVTESGTNHATDEDQPTVVYDTNFTDGVANSTYIHRDGDLATGVPASEYVEFDEDGNVVTHAAGGPDISRGAYVATIAGLDLDDPDYEYHAGGPEIGDLDENHYVMLDPDSEIPIGHRTAIEYERGDNNRFTGSPMDALLAEPLMPSSETPSAFDIPAALRARSTAANLDEIAPQEGTEEYRELLREQDAYEVELEQARTDEERAEIQAEYFRTHRVWIDRGPDGTQPPMAMASTYVQGLPPSEMFGSERAEDPHVAMARSEIQGTTEDGQESTTAILRNIYADLTYDEITQIETRGAGGAESETVVGEHFNADGQRLEQDIHSTRVEPRTQQGLPPITITEVSRAQWNDQGQAIGDHYTATASSDSQQTSLREQTDSYGTDGVIDTREIDETTQSRDWSQETVDDFVAANEAAIELARNDDFHVNDDATSLTVPPVGSFRTTSETDITFDDQGRPIHETVHEVSQSVQATTDEEYDDEGNLISQTVDANGVKLTTVTTDRERGGADNTSPIYDEAGNPLVPQDVITNINTVAFDPDDGQAGGNNSREHQWREITDVTMGSTIGTDGRTTVNWVTPYTTQILQEGHDDDWVFEEKQLKTRLEGESWTFALDDENKPIELEEGDSYTDRHGNQQTFDDDPSIKHDDLDFADDFESFMEDWGSKIVMVGTIAAGVALAFTGVGSAAGLALIGIGLTLSSTQLAYTAINYSQGEASGWDLALDAVGVAGFAVSGLQGVRMLTAASRGASTASAAARTGAAAVGASDDVARGGSLFARGANSARTAVTGRIAGVADDPWNAVHLLGDAGDIYDGSQAIKAAINGDWTQAAMFSAAMLGNFGAGRAGRNWRATHSFGSGGPNPTIPSNLGGGGTPDVIGTPDVSIPTNPGAPSVTSGVPTITTGAPDGGSTSFPIGGTNTGNGSRGGNGTGNGNGADGAPASDVAGTRGDGVSDARPIADPAPVADSAPAADVSAENGGVTTPAIGDTSVAGARSDVADVAPVVSRAGSPADNPELVAALQANGQLDNAIGDVHVVGVTPDGRTFFLDQGVPGRNRGMEHIVADHGTDFANVGIEADAIPGYIAQAMTTGRPVGISGRDRVVYEFDFDGQTRRVAVTVSDRGFIVGANPVSMDRTPGGMPRVEGQRSLKPIPETFPEFARFQEQLNLRLAGVDVTPAAGAPDVANAADGENGDAGGIDDAREIGNPFNRGDSRANRAPLEPPLPRDREIVGNINLRDATAASLARPDLFQGDVDLGLDGLGPHRIVGRDEWGRVRVQRDLTRATSLDNIFANNPDVIARLGGPDAVRANPALLDGQTLTIRRSDGSVETGWTARGMRDGMPNLHRTDTRSIDIGEIIVRRQLADPSFDGRQALADIIHADPSILQQRPLRLRRSPHAIAEGRAAHNIDDGWYVTGITRNADGTPSYMLTKSYWFEQLSPAAQAQARRDGLGPGQRVDVTRRGITADELLDFNRARLEGDHGQLPAINVRYRTPDGHLMGTGRNLQDSALAARADQAVVHTQAALDYLYSRYGYVPSGGDITLVMDADGTFDNASMSSRNNVLRIGDNRGTGAEFDPSVIMHELGHKMVDDLTVGFYGRTQAGAIHEGYADVMAAAWTNDPIIGRNFGVQGSDGIRNLRTGANLIRTRQEWDQAYLRGTNATDQARQGVSAHSGSGVVTRVADRLAGDPLNPVAGDLGWTEVGSLFHDSLRTGAMSRDMTFQNMSDALRVAAARRYGINSPQYARLETALLEGGLSTPANRGAQVSRITSRNTVEHGLTVEAFDAHGNAILRRADGTAVLAPQAHLLTGGGRGIQLDAGGVPVPVTPRDRGSQGHNHADDAYGVDEQRFANDPDAGRAPIVPVQVQDAYRAMVTRHGDDGLRRAGTAIDLPMRLGRELTAGELDAIATQAGLPHREANQLLRDGVTDARFYGGNLDLATHVAGLDSAIATGEFAADGTVFRGLRMTDGELQQLLATGRFTDAAYMSATRSPAAAYRFASTAMDVDAGAHRVVFEIDVAAGQQALDITNLSSEGRHESEVLLPRNSELEIVDVEVGADGMTIARARLANPASDVAGTSGGPARVPRYEVQLGGPAAVDGPAFLVNGAHDVNAEVFVFDGPVADAMRAAATRGGAHMNVDPEIMTAGRAAFDTVDAAPLGNAEFDARALAQLHKDLKGNKAGRRALQEHPARVLELLRINQKNRTAEQKAELEAMGIPGETKAPRLKNHAKVISADGQRAIITTGAFMNDTRFRQEITFDINDPAAVAALDRWMAAGRTEGGDLAQAAADLQQHEIFVNDPLAGSGSYHLTDRLVSMIDDVQAGETIQITTKNFADGDAEQNVITKALDRARARGVDVQITDPYTVSGLSVHGNAIITPRAAYAGTAHLSSAALSPSKRGRNSREIGVVSTDPQTIAEIRGWSDQINADGPAAYTSQQQLVDALKAREAAARRAGDTYLADALKQQRKEAERLPLKAYSIAREARADAEYLLSVLDNRRVIKQLKLKKGDAVTELREQLRGLSTDVATAYAYRGWVGQLAQSARQAMNGGGGVQLPWF